MSHSYNKLYDDGSIVIQNGTYSAVKQNEKNNTLFQNQSSGAMEIRTEA